MSIFDDLYRVLLTLTGNLESHTTSKEDEVVLTPVEVAAEALEKALFLAEQKAKESAAGDPKEDDATKTIPRVEFVCGKNFNGGLRRIPYRRKGPDGVFSLYGRAPKDRKHKTVPKARLHVAEDLSGSWNRGSGRLYILSKMEPYLREALHRCNLLGVLDYIEKLGAYNHRHMRHNKNAPLSLHSWGCALDVNSADNRAKYWSPTWKNDRRGPVPMPFSKGWISLWPNGVPYGLVRAFLSVGFEWGGDWGRHLWIDVVRRYGVGYDEESLPDTKLVRNARSEWRTISFIDPMHFQLVWVRERSSGDPTTAMTAA